MRLKISDKGTTDIYEIIMNDSSESNSFITSLHYWWFVTRIRKFTDDQDFYIVVFYFSCSRVGNLRELSMGLVELSTLRIMKV